jgi:hypothetical protein
LGPGRPAAPDLPRHHPSRASGADIVGLRGFSFSRGAGEIEIASAVVARDGSLTVRAMKS